MPVESITRGVSSRNAGGIAGVHLIRVQGVVIAGGARVHDELCAFEIFHQDLFEGVAGFDFGTDAIGGSLTLTDGSHFISAAVEIIDPAAAPGTANVYGFGDRSESLEIVVDTTIPAVFFGDPANATDGLHPDSDSGDSFAPATLSDRATNDTTPKFFGRAEANTIIRAFVDRTNDGFTVDDLLIGHLDERGLDTRGLIGFVLSQVFAEHRLFGCEGA